MDIHPLVSIPERPLCLPAHLWENKLITALLKQVSLKKDIHIGTTSVILNKLALISVFQGSLSVARRICECHIQLCCNLAIRDNNNYSLQYAVQPWINLVRLSRSEGDTEKIRSAYSLLSPANRRMPIDLGLQSCFSLEQLIVDAEDNQLRDVLDNVFWIEYGKYLLRSNDPYTAKEHCLFGLKSDLNPMAKTSLLEFFVISDASIEMKPSLFSYIERILKNVNGEKWVSLSFLLLKMQIYKAFNVSLDNIQLSNLRQTYSDRSNYGVHMKGLLRINSVIDAVEKFEDVDGQLAMINIQQDIANQLNDEISIFIGMQKKVKYGACTDGELKKKFYTSKYAMIRNAIGVPILEDNKKLDMILSCVEDLSKFEFSSCSRNLTIALAMP